MGFTFSAENENSAETETKTAGHVQVTTHDKIVVLLCEYANDAAQI